MALADTARAIGAVSLALKQRIDTISGITVSVGRPSQPATTNPHLNLFLYEISFDPYLKNTPLNEGERPPLWVVLKYLLTAFEAAEDSDSEKAHEHLGAALRAVNSNDLLRLDGLPIATIDALAPNPSALHITFDESPPDLVAKLMQGPDDKVRLSACFQVRPVMIAPAEPPEYSLLVGVDYSLPVPAPTEPYVGLDIIPSMGPMISEISPTGFEVGEEVTVRGTDMHLSDMYVSVGPAQLPIVMQTPTELRFRVDPAIIATSGISAGSHAVNVVKKLTGTGKTRKSNIVVGNLVPTLTAAAVVGAVNINGGLAFATIDLTGVLLGLDTDDTILAFFRDGAVETTFDEFTLPPGPPSPQTGRRLVMALGDAVPVGDYKMILMVNGQRAPQSPTVHLDVP
jgi:uncharacterized protein DUF4255/IPT/TIG domain-containing protein